ncbi:hypothetical protein [Oceanobacillus kapialis]|uniref:Uncharacterized protein n=1 Tax=Oceanobacillus kapialis TaxID=481353 RepID=A0ABW5PZI5_9BACI
MEKKLPGHIAGFGTLRDMERFEQDYYGEFTDAGLSELIIKDELTTKECDRLCAELSGEVILYKG